MSSEIAKYKLLTETDCDICRGYYDTVYEFTYTTQKKGENIVSFEKCRFCPDCLESVRREFGDHGSI